MASSPFRLIAAALAACALAGCATEPEPARREPVSVVPAAVPAPPVRQVAASDVDRPAYSLPPSADDFAVVVGVESDGRPPNAGFAERDAAAVRDHLTALGYPAGNVLLLTGAEASRARLDECLGAWLSPRTNSASTVVFYFSGRGASDPASGASYLVLAGGDPRRLEDGSAYPVSRLYAALARLSARRLLVVLDAGPLGGSVPARIAALTASSLEQPAASAPEQGHGLFTYYLLKALNDLKGKADLAELYRYLAPRVADDARLQHREQTPQLFAADGADLGLR